MVRWQDNGLGGIALLGMLTTGGCGDPCLDDGFGGGDCPAAGQSSDDSNTTGPTPSTSDGNPVTLDGTTSQGSSSSGPDVTTLVDSSSSSDDTATTSNSSSSSSSSGSSGDTTSGLQTFCRDADGDGVPDLDDCVDADPDDPPPDHIPPGDVDDCDDTNPDVYPGAAANEPRLCTIDVDGDGWGSPLPPPGADPGSDCDDDSPFTFPGAADLEQPPLDTSCLRDEDDDGWGDETPPPGVIVGTDCVDDDPAIIPGAAANEPALCTIDADDDGWGDWNGPGLDPAADEGSDCDDADPLVERCALLVTQDGTANVNLDAPLVPALQALGLTVLLGEDSLMTPASADPAVLVVVSTSSFSFEVGNTFRNVDEGVIVLEGLVWDDMDMAPEGTTSTNDDVAIVDDTHPIAAGLSGTVSFMVPGPAGIFRTAPGPNAQLVASRVSNMNHIVVFAFETGVTMRNGFVAPGRRVGFGTDIGGGGINGQLTTDGLAMFSAAASWAITSP